MSSSLTFVDGSKVSSKVGGIESLLGKVDIILLGRGLETFNNGLKVESMLGRQRRLRILLGKCNVVFESTEVIVEGLSVHIHSFVIKKSFSSNVFVCNGIINTYSKLEDSVEMLQNFLTFSHELMVVNGGWFYVEDDGM
ncbi:hypothetical protein CASFOL_026220 [Castilleja foliolosa]|uniref:Uncharacterized protein n=1 Tax=Castilleja foliolosa TaxID=1961234 RepID=A0ABD3CJ06_9LAMI